MKQAVIAKEHDASIEPTIFYMDIRAYGKDFDKYYEKAKSEGGVRFVRSMVSGVVEDPVTPDLDITFLDSKENFKQKPLTWLSWPSASNHLKQP